MSDTFEQLLGKVNEKLENANLYYFSNDPERALGLENYLKNFHIIYIDKTNYENSFKQKGLNYFCLEEKVGSDIYRSSVKLIKSKEFEQYFAQSKKEKNYFQTFKISSAFSFAARDFSAEVLNTSSSLNHLFEDKVSQFKELNNINVSLPNSFTAKFAEIDYKDIISKLGEKFVIQFNRGHTGSGTVFVDKEYIFDDLKSKFTMMEVKFSEYISGNAYTLNAVVGSKDIFMGGLSFQITGVEGLTPNLGGTIGNDWSYRKDFINGIEKLKNDVIKIGEKMRSKGYLGLFGIDLIVDKYGNHKIIEINARQPASIPLHTKIQINDGQIPLSLIHIAEFMKIDYLIDAKTYNEINLAPKNYSQVFIRPDSDLKLNDDFPMGVYTMRGDMLNNNRIISGEYIDNVYFIDEERDKALIFLQNAYSIDQIENSEAFLVLSQCKNRLIKQNAELARIQLRNSAIDNDGNLISWIKEVLLYIKEHQS